jgi:hypothetical protein
VSIFNHTAPCAVKRAGHRMRALNVLRNGSDSSTAYRPS